VPHHPNTQVCTHVRVTGHRCGSPALRGERFCYFHQRMMRGVPVPQDARLHPVALIENEEAIQASLMEVINAIARNTIDIRRAELILKALHIAVKNTRRTHFDDFADDMVREVPEYPAPEPPPTRPELERPGEIAAHAVAAGLLRAAGVSMPSPEAQEIDALYPTPILARSWEAMLKEASDRCAVTNPVTNNEVTKNEVTKNEQRTESSAKEKSAINSAQRKPPARAEIPATERTVRKKG
jgi:hypothetical protein